MLEKSELFLDQLAYFGGNISGNAGRLEARYQDIEEFIVSATNRMSDDVRITHCFLTWLSFYGGLLSPSKLRRLLIDKKYNKSVLGAFVSILKDVSFRKKQWELFSPLVKKGSHRDLYPDLPAPRQSINSHFKKFGIIAHPFKPNEPKFLVPLGALFQRCPELKYRASGLDPVPSDLRAFLEKESPHSLYEVAKATHHFRAQVYQHYKSFAHYGICDGSLLTKKAA
jgi:hypothetical protein